MAKLEFEEQYARAARSAAEADTREPRAVGARYDKKSKRIVVELRSGAGFSFPPELAQGLAGASSADLANIVVTPSGSGLRWPSLDADFSLAGLMMGVFGTQGWMAEIGRKGGLVKSEAKAAAVRENGRKGGRPKKPKNHTGTIPQGSPPKGTQ